MTDSLSDRERQRYARNLLIKEWSGEKKQLLLKNSKVLVVGAGGSGSPLLYYLTTAGVGTIIIADGDVLDISNLNRQILHNEEKVGKNKALSAQSTLTKLNSDISIVAHPYHVTDENIAEYADDCDLICCAADERNNRSAYKVLNRFSKDTQTPLSWAGGCYMGGFVTFIQPPTTPCMECFLKYSDESVQLIRDGKVERTKDMAKLTDGPNPVLGAATGVAGSMQAMEAIKYLAGFGKNLWNKMLLFQMGDEMCFNTYDISKHRKDECPYCSVNTRL
ncbi:MAG: HesA/MoeB/ThiF family protein [Deltaproteobacteria bacterium]|jgi:molybdopterin/thiamine biosynthesis adenylyltransferase|nr:HesA/MoeB/ThiF family protein [Deltaproteobacteria bacterium]